MFHFCLDQKKGHIVRCIYSNLLQIAILIDLVRGELHMERCKRLSAKNDEVQQKESKNCQTLLFWNAGVLELVELVLRPPKGGPPSLPEHGDVVLS